MRKGFTLLELLIVMGIIAVIAGVSLVSLVGRRNTAELTTASQKITALLREAQSRAVTQASFSAWGVHFDNTTATPSYSLFAGTYGTSSRENYYTLPSSLTYASFTPAGSSTDVIFTQLTGKTSATSSIVIAMRTDNTKRVTITVDMTGLISTQ